MEIIESKLDRKLIKSLFMPMVYGKTTISMGNDIRQQYGDLLSSKDSSNLAKLCANFWSHKYPDIVNFMELISLISRLCSEMDRAVVYSTPYLTTKQDYMSFVKEEIMVYERTTKKRRRVTLKVPTMNRDRRKTKTSACANFIHQKDAYIAMKVVESLLIKRAPIYTVHDNFLTTAPYAQIVPDIYTEVFMTLGSPLKCINDFIRQNLIIPYFTTGDINNLPSPLYNHDNNSPMPSDYLTDLLNKLPPTKEKKKWDEMVSDFVMHYNKYVDAVGSNQEKWEKFKKLIENRSNNYSLHY
jgi:DNA-directed RNA polymerase